jgi:hypothetical protein
MIVSYLFQTLAVVTEFRDYALHLFSNGLGFFSKVKLESVLTSLVF